MLRDAPARLRWPRSQRFRLSEAGDAAEAAYRQTIIASRAQEGRASFDAARTAWAEAFRIQPDDGLYLAEVGRTGMTLADLVSALETCGKSRKDAMEALERLMEVGLISTGPVHAQP
jgi:hypothetical protein